MTSLATWLVISVLATGSPMLWPAVTYAEQRTPAQATAHAIDELANCRAQLRPECPTETPTPTPTLTATSTATPEPSATPTASPTDPPPADPLLSLPAPRPGSNPVGGYLRPSADGNPATLELALRQGRWDVNVRGCDLLGPWSNVWLVPLEGGPVLAGVDYFAELDETLTCPIVPAGYRSDVPCAQDEDGRCEVQEDGGYWDAVAAQQAAEPDATEVPVTPTPIVITRVVQAPPRPAPPPQIVYQEAATPEPVVITVVATVLAPANTPTPAPRPTLTPTVLMATATPVPTVDVPTPEPLAAPVTTQPVEAGASSGIGIAGLGLAALAVLLVMLRHRGDRED